MSFKYFVFQMCFTVKYRFIIILLFLLLLLCLIFMFNFNFILFSSLPLISIFYFFLGLSPSSFNSCEKPNCFFKPGSRPDSTNWQPKSNPRPKYNHWPVRPLSMHVKLAPTLAQRSSQCLGPLLPFSWHGAHVHTR